MLCKCVWAAVVLSLLAGRCSAARPTGFANHLILLYKGNYIAYGHGRTSERDLPECSSTGLEACNLRHERYWAPPLVERLCRCPGHTPCPIHSHQTHNQTIKQGDGPSTGAKQLFVQHVSNRAQLHFCEVERSAIPRCSQGEAGLQVTLRERYAAHNSRSQHQPSSSSTPAIVRDTHTQLLCRCGVPRYWRLRNTQLQLREPQNRGDQSKHTSRLLTEIHTYICHKLPECEAGDRCSAVRPDTQESYYTCSCPHHQLCLVPRNATAQRTTTHTYPHHDGPTKAGICTPHYPTQSPRSYG